MVALRADEEPIGLATFDGFYRQSLLPAVRLAHLLTGSNATGEDLAQEALMRTQMAWGQLESPSAYLRTVLVNLCRSHLRRQRVALRAPVPLPQPTGQPEYDDVWVALGALSERYRSVLVLRYYLDLPISEVAAHLDMSAPAVKSLINRGLRKLQRELGDLDG